jgi:hypothetical protein
MTVRLRTTSGVIKEYKTTYVIRGGQDDLDKYATNCEGELKKEPSPQEECDHLDCAIYAAEYTVKNEKTLFKISFIGYMFWVSIGLFFGENIDPWMALSGGGVGLIILLFGIHNIYRSNRYAKMAKELIEFRDHGTINGIKSSRIFEDKEVANAKHWWQFRR